MATKSGKPGSLLAFCIALPLFACSSEIRQAEEAVRTQLTDPGSAQFQNVVRKGDYICGEVNSKNKQGGYVGFRHFYISERGKGPVRIDPRSWATPASREIFGNLTGPDNDTDAFEAVYKRACS